MEENSSLRTTLQEQEKTQEELEERNNILIKTINNLRGLISSLIKDANVKTKEDARVMKALQQLEFQNILIDSEPPPD